MTTMTTTTTMTMKRMVSRFAPGLHMRFPTLSRRSGFAAAAAAAARSQCRCASGRHHPQVQHDQGHSLQHFERALEVQ
jgi:hypothetical protein